MITILEIKNKLKEHGYTGKIPIKKQELIDLYENLYGKLEGGGSGGETLIQLKQKLKMMGYSGKIPIKKSEIVNLIENLNSKKEGFKYQIFENLNFNKIISKLSNQKLELQVVPKSVDVDNGIELIEKYVSHIQPVVMNLDTKSNTSTFKCLKKVDKNDKFIFLLVKDDSKNFDFVKINDKIVLNKDEIPQTIYTKLADQCDTLIIQTQTGGSYNKCDVILDKLNIDYTVESITGDGNCFYHFVATAMELNNYKLVRQRFADNFTKEDWELMNALFGNKLKYKQIFSREDYIQKMLLRDGVWVPDSIIEMLFSKSFPDTTLVLFDNDNTKCNLICPLVTLNKHFIFGRYQKNLHYDLYKINGKTKLTWNEIPTSLQNYMKECKNFAQEFNTTTATTVNETKLKYTETEFDTISQMTVNEIKLLFQQKNYIGKLPVHKKELLELFKELFVTPKVVGEEIENVNYDTMSLPEIQDELKKKGITKNLPRKKDLLIKLLKAPRCKPMENVWCDENSICDVMNNVCIDSSQVKSTNIQETIGTHKISGSKSIVNELKSKIKVDEDKDVFSEIETSPTTHVHTVSNKKELLKYLVELQTQTTLSSFNHFLQTVI